MFELVHIDCPARPPAVLEANAHQSIPKRPRADSSVSEPESGRLKLNDDNLRSELYPPGAYLAPMVRIGTLPTRLLALEYGADLVWGPEIVDKAIIGSERVVDGKDQWDDSIYQKQCQVFNMADTSYRVTQIGSADKELALKAARTVAHDVSGIDLNCGCPKDFSLKGGMGAALLKEPDKLCCILSHLIEHLPTHPISAKIRLLPDQAATLSLVKKISDTGVSCLTVHCRTQLMRSTEPALLHRLKEIVDYVKTLRGRDNPLPVVANGDCFGVADMDKIKHLTGVARVMIARGAESNVSCFRSGGLLDPITEVMPLYIKIGLVTGQAYPNAKYCLSTMDVKSPNNEKRTGLGGTKFTRKELKSKIQLCKDWSQISELFEINMDEIKQTSLRKLLPTISPSDTQTLN